MTNIALKSIKSNVSATNFKILKKGFDIKNRMAIRSVIGNKLVLKKGCYLAQALKTLPSGIIDKQATGIGATSLEIKSHRHSILVMPTKALAHQKATDNCLYVGSEIPKKRKSIGLEAIKRYHDSGLRYKKILVVADSLHKVIQAIGTIVYQEYYILIDEIDSYQSDIDYRESLGYCIDYYLRFANRGMVSATLRNFSQPELKLEPKYIIGQESHQTIDLEILETNDPVKMAKDTILGLCTSSGKILVAINSIQMSLEIINLLGGSHDCKILCGERSREKYLGEISSLYGELNEDKLPAKFNFITSAYFRGIDIYDKVNVVLVTDVSKQHTLLSLEKVRQILGRPRNGFGKVTLVCKLGKSIPNDPIRKDLQNAQQVIAVFSKMLRSKIPLSSVQLMKKALTHDLPIRIDVDEGLAISYLQIDFESIQDETKRLYIDSRTLCSGLRNAGFRVKYKKIHLERTDVEKDALKKYHKRRSRDYQRAMETFIDNKLNGTNYEIDKSFRQSLENIYHSINYILNNENRTCDIMKKHLVKQSEKKLKSILANLQFSKLTLKEKNVLFEQFEISQLYSPSDIYLILRKPEVQSVLLTLNVQCDYQTTAVSTLKIFFGTDRTSRRPEGKKENCERILNRNPFDF